MGEQLELFGGPATSAPRLGEPSELAAELSVSESQMDLFGDRWLRAQSAHDALASFDLEGAQAALHETLRVYPGDATLMERAERIGELAEALKAARRTAAGAARALLAIGARVPEYLSAAWHRQVAVELEREFGEGARLEGVSAGEHWLRAGELLRAEASLRRSLAQDPADGRARGYLGDALLAQQRKYEARAEYRDALAHWPHAVDIASVADSAVRALPSAARNEYALPGAAVEWAAVLGVLESVFVLPAEISADWLDSATLERLPSGLRFYRCLVAETVARDDTQRLFCRRQMKSESSLLWNELRERRQ